MRQLEVEQTAMSWPEKAQQILIHDQASYIFAANTLLDIAKIEKNIKAHHEPIKAAAYIAHKTAVGAEKKFLDPLNRAKAIVKKAISGWEQKQAEIRAEADRKAREEARRVEEDSRLRRAIEATNARRPESEIEEILNTPDPIEPPAPAVPTFDRVPGVGTRETWRAEVTDIMALCKAIGEGKAAPTLVQPFMPLLNSMARNLHDSMSVPGVKAVKDVSVTTR